RACADTGNSAAHAKAPIPLLSMARFATAKERAGTHNGNGSRRWRNDVNETCTAVRFDLRIERRGCSTQKDFAVPSDHQERRAVLNIHRSPDRRKLAVRKTNDRDKGMPSCRRKVHDDTTATRRDNDAAAYRDIRVHRIIARIHADAVDRIRIQTGEK